MMAFIPYCNIKIGRYTFTGVNEVVVKKSIHSISQTCTIKLPLSGVIKTTEGISVPVAVAELIKRGDKIQVELWYKNLPKIIAFNGFVSKIDRSQPLIIECENNAFILKMKSIKTSFYKINVIELIEKILAGTDIELDPIVKTQNLKLLIEQMQVQDKSIAWVLQEIKDKFLISSYFTSSGKLYAGLLYGRRGDSIKYHLQKNVLSPESLKWQEKEDIKTLIRVVCYKKDGTKQEAEYGDRDGEVRTISVYDVEDKEQLKKIAQAENEKYRFSGFKGEIETLLYPNVSPGDLAEIKDELYPERSGTYFISSVTTTFGMGGGRQKVELDIKISA